MYIRVARSIFVCQIYRKIKLPAIPWLKQLRSRLKQSICDLEYHILTRDTLARSQSRVEPQRHRNIPLSTRTVPYSSLPPKSPYPTNPQIRGSDHNTPWFCRRLPTYMARP